MLAEYDRRRRLVVDGLNAIGLRTFEPRGAFYAFPEVTAATGLSSEDFAQGLLQEERVAVVPGLGVRAERRGPRPGLLRDVLRAARGGARPDRPVRRAQPRRGHPMTTPTVTPAAAALERYEAVIGIEVHCQLKTASKMFCGCSTAYAGAAAEQPHLPGLPRACRARCRRSTGGPSSTSSRPASRSAPTTPDGDPLGPQELLLPGPAEGLPDQPVRPAARVARPAGLRDVRGRGHDRDHPGPPRGGHRQAHPRDRRRTAAASASSTSTARARR